MTFPPREDAKKNHAAQQSHCQWIEAEILKGIDKNLPTCSYRHSRQILKVIARQYWLGLKLSAVIEQVATNYIRHELTDYDDLIDHHGLTPEEARIAVEREISETLGDWRQHR